MEELPEKVQKFQAENPGQLSIMEWKAEHEFEKLPVEMIAQYQKFIHREFLGLLRYGGSDDEHRERLKQHEGISNFARRHPIIFEKITNREFATNPRLMYPLEFQLYIRKMVDKGILTETNGKAMVAECVTKALVEENLSRGNVPKASKKNSEKDKIDTNRD